MPQTPKRPYADTPTRFSCSSGNQNWLLKCNLFAIATRSAAIDNDKLALQEKRKQSVMPDAFRVVDAFTSARRERRAPSVRRKAPRTQLWQGKGLWKAV